MRKISLALKAFQELNKKQILLYSLYQLSLRSGYLHYVTRKAPRERKRNPSDYDFQSFLELPGRENLISILGPSGLEKLIEEADEIINGKVRLFGNVPVALTLSPPSPIQHWTRNKDSGTNEPQKPENLESDIQTLKSKDIKFIWEPCRFGWAFTLGRAYYITDNEDYASGFWKYAERFLDSNPAYQGPNWSSGQEVALRLIAFAFSLQVFHQSHHSILERKERLAISIADHADRIPPTLIYARAQNNNHLLSEAVGLYTAGLALPAHPRAKKWRELGWKWFNQGILAQIAEDGNYVQHSTNYHRLMLQLALWMNKISSQFGQKLPDDSLNRLAEATHWIQTLLDPISGKVPNLGPNDGAYIFPLSNCPFEDYRPVIQSAAEAFLDAAPIQSGLWDEMGAWLGLDKNSVLARENKKIIDSSNRKESRESRSQPTTILSQDEHSWAYLRTTRFDDRPGHADQLHLDLWWDGMNITQDAGTFSYNAPPPWNNALVHTDVHNTLLIENHDQMTQAGRFLFLDWAQATIISEHFNQKGIRDSLVAQHDGYRKLGVIHQREVCTTPEGGWTIKDRLIPTRKKSIKSKVFSATLQWLLPDWPWILNPDNQDIQDELVKLTLESPKGNILLAISMPKESHYELPESKILLARAGESVHGQGIVSPTWGWSSPTYGVRIPALSLRVTTRASLPVLLLSKWSFEPQTE